jgi:hypothetical protein
VSVERQCLAVPIASTTVVASTASTAHARKTVTKSAVVFMGYAETAGGQQNNSATTAQPALCGGGAGRGAPLGATPLGATPGSGGSGGGPSAVGTSVISASLMVSRCFDARPAKLNIR